MCNLGFPEIDIFSRMNEEVKEYLDNNERDRFKFVNIADKYDLDLSFLGLLRLIASLKILSIKSYTRETINLLKLSIRIFL